MSKPVILTGLRANADFHIGNYLGAILPVVELQQKHAGEYQINMFVPDLHSFTTPIDHGKLYQNTLNNLKVFVAAGLDIDNPDTFIYRQSYIPAHSELTWILSCFTYVGRLQNMTQYKDKVSQLSKTSTPGMQMSESFARLGVVTAGLFIYPVLMAADILLYGAKWIPVGEDQKQHLELAREVAIRMNNKFGDMFILPEEWDKQLEFANREGIRIRSLRNPDKKMSKSVDDPNGTILLTDKPEDAAKKVMSATTDSDNSIKIDWTKKPGISNLIQISALLTDKSANDIVKQWEGQTSYGDFKKAVAEQVKEFLTDFQSKLAQVDEAKLKQKLEVDEKAMNEIANETLLKVQKAVGLRP